MRRDRMTQLALPCRVTHLMPMSNEEILAPAHTRFRRKANGPSRSTSARGPIIDQEGREIPEETLRDGFQRFQFDFAHSTANPFGGLTREQRLGRFEEVAEL